MLQVWVDMPQETPQREMPQPSVGKQGTNGKYLLRVKDPEGYEIGLELKTWDNHIVVQHPEMKRFFDLLEKTLSDPQLIQQSPKQNETFYYYRLTGRSFHRVNDIYLSAVVKRDEETKTGVVKTAHLLRELRKEGLTVWMKRN
jgi:hypothetical protein